MKKDKLAFKRKQFTPLSDSQWQDIKKYIENERPRKYPLRTIVDGTLKLTRTGVQWRNLECHCPWQLVYYYFRKWQKGGQFAEILLYLVQKDREFKEKDPESTAVAVDSQSVKKGSLVKKDTGIDGNKNVNGRKRHIAVNSDGLPLAIHVSAANVHDGEAGLDLLWKLDKATKKIQLIRGDYAYGGVFEKCANYYNWRVEISQKPESKQGFVPQKGRWQVERSFAWLNFFRRLSKDYEKTVESSIAFIQLAFIDIILARF